MLSVAKISSVAISSSFSLFTTRTQQNLKYFHKHFKIQAQLGCYEKPVNGQIKKTVTKNRYTGI
jgi:hypothetical protein